MDKTLILAFASFLFSLSDLLVLPRQDKEKEVQKVAEYAGECHQLQPNQQL